MEASTSGTFPGSGNSNTKATDDGNNDDNTNDSNLTIDAEHQRIQQLSANLRTRLSLAMVKVQHGWVDQSFEQLEELHGIGRGTAKPQSGRPVSLNVLSDAQVASGSQPPPPQPRQSSQDTTTTTTISGIPQTPASTSTSTITTPNNGSRTITPSISLSQLSPSNQPPVTPSSSRHRRTSSEPGQINFTPSPEKSGGRHAFTSTRVVKPSAERTNPYYEYNQRHQQRDNSKSPTSGRTSGTSPSKARWSRTSFTTGGDQSSSSSQQQQQQQMSSQEDADAVESLISLSSPQKLRNETNELTD